MLNNLPHPLIVIIKITDNERCELDNKGLPQLIEDSTCIKEDNSKMILVIIFFAIIIIVIIIAIMLLLYFYKK